METNQPRCNWTLQKYWICATVCVSAVGLMYLLVDFQVDISPLQDTGQILLTWRRGDRLGEISKREESKSRRDLNEETVLEKEGWITEGRSTTSKDGASGQTFHEPTERGRQESESEKSETTTRGRLKTDGAWAGTRDPLELYAYSAFYDDRASLATLPVVRVIVVTEAADRVQLRCLLRYENGLKVRLTARRLGIGYGVTRHGKRFREFVLSCQLKNRVQPTNVTILTAKTSEANWAIPVELPRKPERKQEFGVCVSVCYGNKWDLYKLVEWMELVKILGVSKVGIYNNTLGNEASRIFRYYDRKGLVDFRQSWNFIPDPGVLTSHLHWSPVINDCLYRNLFSFEKIIVMDVDEVIVPKNVYNLSELIKEIDRDQVGSEHPARTYTFRNNYFFYDIPKEDTTVPKYIKMLKHRWRLPPSPQGYSAKSIISPTACTHAHNHYCWGYTPKHKVNKYHVEVNPKYAVNQHYKTCHFSRDECNKVMQNYTQDDTILKYKNKLIENVNLALKELNLPRT